MLQSNVLDVSKVVSSLLKEGLLSEDIPVAQVYDLDRFHGIIDSLKSTYHDTVLHSVACKAIGISNLLRIMKEKGLGCECASYGEVHHALRLGFAPEVIVFDSPCKTVKEIKDALTKGVSMNIDGWDEFGKVSSIIKQLKLDGWNQGEKQFIGLRINPELNVDFHLSVTCGSESKFGIPVRDIEKIVDAYMSNSWLNGMHVHGGSQHCSQDVLIAGCSTLYDTFKTVNKARSAAGLKEIAVLDIGGGLPVNLLGDTDLASTFAGHAKRVEEMINPNEVRIVTEFGRIYSPSGFVISRVEAVKSCGTRKVAVVHFGSDFALRQVFTDQYNLPFTVYTDKGELRESHPGSDVVVAGPLCFSGDVFKSKDVNRDVQVGDYIVMHNTGSYTMSNWSRYNSRPCFGVLGFEKKAEEFKWTTLKKAEELDGASKFWGE